MVGVEFLSVRITDGSWAIFRVHRVGRRYRSASHVLRWAREAAGSADVFCFFSCRSPPWRAGGLGADDVVYCRTRTNPLQLAWASRATRRMDERRFDQAAGAGALRQIQR